jgi:hypothetical protein
LGGGGEKEATTTKNVGGEAYGGAGGVVLPIDGGDGASELGFQIVRGGEGGGGGDGDELQL